jgi:hypothetical protein
MLELFWQVVLRILSVLMMGWYASGSTTQPFESYFAPLLPLSMAAISGADIWPVEVMCRVSVVVMELRAVCSGPRRPMITISSTLHGNSEYSVDPRYR